MKRSLLLLLTAVLAASAMICPSCGASNPDDAEDCWNCGTLLADMYPCPNCGHLNSAEAIFCAGCFAELPQNPSIPPDVPTEPDVPAEPEEPVEPERSPVPYVGDFDVFLSGRLGPAYALSAWPMSYNLSVGCDVGLEDYLSLDVTYLMLGEEYDCLVTRIGLTTYRLSNPPLLFRLGTSLGYAKQRSLIDGEDEATLEYFDCALRMGAGLLLFPSAAAFLNQALELDLVVEGLFRRGEARLNLTLELGVAFLF